MFFVIQENAWKACFCVSLLFPPCKGKWRELFFEKWTEKVNELDIFKILSLIYIKEQKVFSCRYDAINMQETLEASLTVSL